LFKNAIFIMKQKRENVICVNIYCGERNTI